MISLPIEHEKERTIEIDICKFVPGKLYKIKYKGFSIPMSLHDKIVFCIGTTKHVAARKKKFFEVKVLVGGKIYKLIDFSYNIKEMS